ncbi:MAG: repair protein RadC [Pseudomonadota bacterium]
MLMNSGQIKQFLDIFNNSLNSFDDDNVQCLSDVVYTLNENISIDVAMVDKIEAHGAIAYSETKPRRVFTIDDIVQDIYQQNARNNQYPQKIKDVQQTTNDENKNLFSGHRERARERFIQNDSNSISDYDLLELIMFLIKPRVDVKTEVKKMIDHFYSLRNIANATEDELSQFVSNPRLLKYVFKLCNAVHGRVIFNNIKNEIVLNHWDYMIEYLRSQLCDKDQECFMVFFLNSKYKLINQKIVAYGEVDRVGINPKSIIKDAMNYNSKMIIVAHNHPSGINQPSNSDIEITDALFKMASSMDVNLFDHIIITDKSYFSFRENDLLSME